MKKENSSKIEFLFETYKNFKQNFLVLKTNNKQTNKPKRL